MGIILSLSLSRSLLPYFSASNALPLILVPVAAMTTSMSTAGVHRGYLKKYGKSVWIPSTVCSSLPSCDECLLHVCAHCTFRCQGHNLFQCLIKGSCSKCFTSELTVFAVLFFIDVIIYSFIHVGSIAIQMK